MELKAKDKDFVISFKEGDRAWSELAARVLTEAGYDIDLRPWSYAETEYFLDEVKHYASGGPTLIPILTPAYMTTIHAEPKWFEAYQHGTFPVLPVLVKNCDISSLLNKSHHVDWRYYDTESSGQYLIEYAERHYGKPRHPPLKKPRAKKRTAPAGPTMETIKPIRSLPFQREAVFSGRMELLSGIAHSLEQHHMIVVATDPEAGPGVGRRKLGIEYAYVNAEKYKVIWGLRADHSAVLMEDFARLASSIGLPEAGARDRAFTAQAVRRWLDRNAGWLLVFQNPQDFSAISPYLPNLAQGHILISADQAHWPQVPAVLTVPNWTSAEAVAYVQRMSGEKDAGYAEALAKELHFHTLSLKLALTLMTREGWSVAEICDQLAFQRAELAEYEGDGGTGQFALARVLSLTLKALNERDPEVLQFIKGFAYLNPFNIMPALLMRGARALPKELARDVNDRATVERCMTLITEYGLVEARANSLFLHAMVQSQVRAWLEGPINASIHSVLSGLTEKHTFSLARPAGPTWCKATLGVVLAVFPDVPDKPEHWEHCGLLLPHVLTVLEHCARLEVDPAAEEELLYRLGTYFLARESLEFAHDTFNRAVQVAEAAHGAKHANVMRALVGFGKSAAALERHDEAIACFSRLVQGGGGLFGAATVDVTAALVMLGESHLKKGEGKQALACFEEALQRDKASRSGPHEDLMRDFLLIGDAHRVLGDLTRAWSYYEQAQLLQHTLKALGPMAEARIGRRLGALHHAMGDLRNARSYLRETIALQERAEGQGSAALSEIITELGEIEEELGDNAEARKLFKKAMRIDEAIFGPRDPRVGRLAECLGRTATALQLPDKAKAAYATALQIYEASYGPEHTKTDEVRTALRKIP